MANYLVHHTKKKQILHRKEAALRRLIETGALDDELLAAAAEIREARIRVLQVQRSIIIPNGDCEGKYGKVDQKINQVASLSPAEILAEFGVPQTGGDRLEQW